MRVQLVDVGAINVQVSDDKAVLSCQICKSNIGVFDPERIHLPVTPDQFESIDPFHGMLPPFPYVVGRMDETTHKNMRCPRCQSYPFLRENMVLTPFGYFEVGKDREVPRKRTAEDDRQELIEKEWGKVEGDGKSLAELNQDEINRAWAAYEARELVVSEADRVLDEAAGRNRFFKKRGKPRKG